MERGVFSSLSTVTFFHSNRDDRRRISPNSTLRHMSATKSRSIARSKFNESTSPGRILRKEI